MKKQLCSIAFAGILAAGIMGGVSQPASAQALYVDPGPTYYYHSYSTTPVYYGTYRDYYYTPSGTTYYYYRSNY